MLLKSYGLVNFQKCYDKLCGFLKALDCYEYLSNLIVYETTSVILMTCHNMYQIYTSNKK